MSSALVETSSTFDPAQRTTRGLVRELLSRWRRDARVDFYVPYALIEQMERRLASLPPEQLDAIERATVDLHDTLIFLLEDAASWSAPNRQRLLELTAVARRLACTADRLASRAEERRPELLSVRYARIDVAALVRSIAGAFEGLIARRALAYELRVPEALEADVDDEKLEIVVLHLLFNAVKYTPEAGSMVCELVRDERAGEIVLRVFDSGPCVSLHAVDRIFDRTRNIDRNVRVAAAGVDLDLGTSRDLMALLGGTLDLDQSVPSGALFEARFPQRAPRGMDVAADSHPARRLDLAPRVVELAERELHAEKALAARPVQREGRPLVLIAEDNRQLHRIIVDVLEPEYATASAFDGPTALERAIALRPDLVLIDLGLPGMDGESVIRELRAHGDAPDAAIVVLTGRETQSCTERLFEAGVRDVLRKPFVVPELCVRVRALVYEKRTRDLLREMLGEHEKDLLELAEEVARKQRRLQAVMEDLEQARASAETASQIKSNFLRIMSHELKTPITAIQLHARLIEREATQSNALKDGVERIGRTSRRLAHLVDTIVEWASVESGRRDLVVEEVDLVGIAIVVADELASYARQKEIELTVLEPATPLPALATDGRIVRIVLRDLVAHAIQITDHGSISLAFERSDASQRILVHDGGEPIAPAEIVDALGPLRSTDDLRRRAGSGSGLGLHAARDIATAIDGDLEVLSGRGNTVVLSLPPLPFERATSKLRKAPTDPTLRGGLSS